jgi:hypothetical protein
MCLIMLMSNRRCHVDCVVQHVYWLVNVQVLNTPRWSMMMEKAKCGVRAQWTGTGEGGRNGLD